MSKSGFVNYFEIEYANLGFRITCGDYCRLFMFQDIIIFKTTKCLKRSLFSITLREIRDYDVTHINFDTKEERDLIYKTLRKDFIMFAVKHAALAKSKHDQYDQYGG